MENERMLIGALIFFLLILGTNFVMYGIVRGMAKGGDSNWMKAFRNTLGKPLEGPANKSMDELRKKMEELQEKKEEN
ncbi:MAG TPA: hypothetical protein VLT51_14610 [Anaerolineales bacterium]|nr:hypothetical protein [Anaerolineales bacterium]